AIGSFAPNIHVSKWVQGLPTNIDKNQGKVVLVEIFQVNCPGCFIYALPTAIELYKKYDRSDLIILGLATAFEDFDKNTLDNLEVLLTSGEVIGETFNALRQYGHLVDGNKLPYKIPFPVGMDIVRKNDRNITESYILDFISSNIENYNTYPESDRKIIFERVKHYLKNKLYTAQTFDEYQLQGTPSAIVVDRKGILQNVSFGVNYNLKDLIQQLINA
ncbi:MAG: TlpA family protein disulfide reductase, partial [Nitrososphaeraceae archaeon]|nr:TlpA family protein disulfide reductase [Nitrososphaeraceae archaeon]